MFGAGAGGHFTRAGVLGRLAVHGHAVTPYIEGSVALNDYGVVAGKARRAAAYAGRLDRPAAGLYPDGGRGCARVAVDLAGGTAFELNLVCDVEKAVHREIPAGSSRSVVRPGLGRPRSAPARN